MVALKIISRAIAAMCVVCQKWSGLLGRKWTRSFLVQQYLWLCLWQVVYFFHVILLLFQFVVTFLQTYDHYSLLVIKSVMVNLQSHPNRATFPILLCWAWVIMEAWKQAGRSLQYVNIWFHLLDSQVFQSKMDNLSIFSVLIEEIENCLATMWFCLFKCSSLIETSPNQHISSFPEYCLIKNCICNVANIVCHN